MTEPDIRIIKKYPNRRLYDTSISSYITLNDIRQLVLQCVNFRVVDARTEEDLTNNTLLQIILEQEGSSAPMFTREILQNVIRFYGNSMQHLMRNYLEQTMDYFVEQQGKFKQGFSVLFEKNPINIFSEIAERNMTLWKDFQNSFIQKSSTTTTPEDKTNSDKKE